MSTLIVFVLGLLCAAMAYNIGRMRTEARWNSRFALAWRQYAEQIVAGEEPTRAAHEQFGDLDQKVKTWSVADGRRLAAEIRKRGKLSIEQELADSPVPPDNVRFRLVSGRIVPVECVYVGVIDGLHRWNAVIRDPVPLEELDGGCVLTDMMPARTTVSVSVRAEYG